jgi:chlorite dismutase
MSETPTLPYHSYLFFDVDAALYAQLDVAGLAAQFADMLRNRSDAWHELYATRGLKANTTFMVWVQATSPEYVTELLGRLLRSEMGGFVRVTYSYFGMTRRSQYGGSGAEDQVIRNQVERLPYLIVYPFTKTIEWHLLSLEERREAMGGHIRVGVKHKGVRQCLLYSYGIDDNEFVVSYETPTLEAFQELVIELRGTEARRYTLNDLPIFTCVHKSPHAFAAWL